MTGYERIIIIHAPLPLTSVFTILGKNEIKLGENYCISGKYFVSLHQQSKESLMCLKTVIYDDLGGG